MDFQRVEKDENGDEILIKLDREELCFLCYYIRYFSKNLVDAGFTYKNIAEEVMSDVEIESAARDLIAKLSEEFLGVPLLENILNDEAKKAMSIHMLGKKLVGILNDAQNGVRKMYSLLEAEKKAGLH